ncbi:E3 ubiquitin-protein ligase MYCBP2 isoform A [Alligator mississippiensis]|uniref:E3 ubiquitin-protein ligase MYCBP2 n=1 Tax=Alligator mississippiensis TaxID=8496 RepID=A0A151NKW3_ALLMI|nr:E3 ubiquitin-protein ligase MYCBP2 isoform A [Alligator mississippiensis]
MTWESGSRRAIMRKHETTYNFVISCSFQMNLAEMVAPSKAMKPAKLQGKAKLMSLLLLSGRALAERYRRIYTAVLSDRDPGGHPGARGKKILSKKKLKRKQKTKLKVKTRNKTENLESSITIPDIRLHSNPSAFNVYCNVRHCVLEWQKKEVSLTLASKNTVQSGDSDSDEEEESKEPPIKLPKIIEVGLCEVFELIKETRFSHPSLCLRSLQALLNVLQGQQPEGLQSEPPEVLESLFQLLLEITVRSTGMNDSTGQSLTALSCACLFSLVAAWGETGRTLQAISAILTNNGSHACQTIQVPTILNSLQRSVQAVLVGKIQIQDWFGNGIKKAALMHKWPLKEICVDEDDQCLLQSDGFFLYLLCKDGLYKIGSGYSGTVRGHIYNSTSRIKNRKEKKSWLGYAQGYLLYRDVNNHNMTAIRINPETLEQDGTVTLPDCHTEGQNILFTDGEYINQIAASRDDGFVVRIFATSTEPVLQQELQLKLARKCLHACGISLFDLEKDLHIISTGFDEESAVLGAGREFALMKTASGKIYYTGKYQSLGIKQGGPSAGKWVELPITKSPKIVQFSVGHDGSHALLVAEDGSIFFTGSASKGEDGESTKSRRQSKPYKPKKIIKMEGKIVVSTACNNGSSSVISKDGELYMFGKDAIYSDSTSLVTDLKGHFVTQVAMGKAHTCVLMKNGEVWTFGVNNKGQCGRDTGSMSQGGKGFGVENMATAMDEDLEEELDEKDEKSMMCPPGMHKWKLEQCMVCTVCGDCTGYGASCVSSGRPDRVPGGELDGQEARQRGILDAVKDMIPLDLLLAVPVPGVNIEEHLQLRQEEKRQRVNRRHRLEEGRGPLVFPGPIFMNHREQALARIRPHPAQLKHKRDKHKDGSGERGEKDASKITTYPPGAVRFDCELRAVQVSCGFHHSVVLMENGDVYTFGYGQHGQLGHGDVNSRGCPTLVQALPGPSTQVTAGSNHTAILLMDGQVFTFGSFSKGQLGRPILDMPYWNAKPAPMPNIGSKYGRKATWIGASGDQTFLRIDEALINSHVLATSEIFASRHIIGLVPASMSEPPPFKCLLINKVDGSCKTFNDSEQEDLQGSGVCLDPVYDVIWRFRPNARELWSYNAVVADSRLPSAPDMQSRCSILSPELALPTGSKALTTRSHAALHILGCLDTLAAMQDLKMGVTNTEEETQAVMKVYSKEDYSVVNRFESHGGGWGYSAHSVEAIRFCADTDILLGGLGLFGGRGEYTAKIKLFELGPDGGDHETDGDLLAETDVLAYDCAAREKYAMMFDEPVLLQAGWWYVAWARVSGPSSDCGSHGQASITTDDGVVFQFKSSKKSNNGTDVNAGQIPQLLYRLPTSDGSASKGKQQTSEPVHILKRSFARTVSVECFESLLSILHWSWTTLVLGVEELRGLKGFQYTATLLDLERLRFVGTCCLRLLRVYTCEIYPISATAKAVVEETSKLADCIGKTRTLLRKILSEGVDHCMVKLDNDPQGYLSQPLSLLEAVLQECHNTFTACFHSFYPTPALQWACLCDLLNCLDQDIQEANFKTSSSRLLAAVMSALCHTSVKLTSIFPIAYDGEVLLRSMVKQVSTENDSALVHRFPLLVAHMEKLSQSEENISGMTSFREVLEKMLVIVVFPVRNSLRRENELFSSHLVSNTCGLLASIVSELTASALGSEVDGLNSLHSVKSSPNRFTKTSQGRSWNTGNGSPDAICFSVDKPGAVVVGFSVYGGGGIHEYELEVLVDDSDHTGDSTHSHRWTSLELIKGTYTTDDSPSDIAEIRLDKVVPLKENVKYAVRLRNYGSRTANGDGGMTTVQCPDGVTFTFSTCSLSSNGTNQTRGQIPQILYYRSEYDGDLQSQLLSKANEEDKNCSRALSVVSAVVRSAKDLLHRALAVDAEDIPELLSSSSLFSMLLPLIIAYIEPVAEAIPKVAVEVFGLVQQLLPSVAVLNQKYAPPAFNPNQSTDSTTGNQPEQGLSACTTSNHYSVIESEHPYKPACVTHYKVTFPECVRWMTVEFDTLCGTAQSEDVLRLLIPVRFAQNSGFGPKQTSVHENLNSWIELKKFSGSSGWPTMVLVLPGNEALFSLETASDYVKDEKACFYGFKCYAIGYEFSPGSDEGIIQLEKELANLGGSCAAALMKKDLALPIAGNEFEEDLEILEEAALQVCKSHSGILGKGLALSHSPTIIEALEGNLPLQMQSNEQSFLEDFITCVSGSSGGRLARWLQPDSYADPQKTSLILNKDDIRCGWPTVITVQTKDQYGDVVHVPNMKVEVKAIPVSQKKTSLQHEQVKKLQRIPGSPAAAASPVTDMTFGGLPSPKLDASYEPMIVKEARYIAITMMKAYENYSFEELRFASPTPKRPSENMLIRVNNDGTYCANWTPGAVGLYTIHVTIDGIEIDAGLEVKVKDPPKGMIPPGTQLVKPKAEPQPNKVRKFVAKDSAGLRIRSHPSLQSEQIGIVKVNGSITFIDEIHNDDGVWLRLNDETIKKYVPNMNGYTEAWCLSFNQHLGKSLLVPVDNVFNASQGVRDLDFFSWTAKAFSPQESRSNTDDFFKDLNSHCPQEAVMQEQDMPLLRGGPGVYKVVKTGPSGHNIRSCPNLRGIPIGMLVLGNRVKAVGEVTNSEGTWVQMDKNSMVEFCESDEGEAWSLARDRGGNQYLRHEDEQGLLEQNVQTPPPSPFSIQAFNKGTSCSNGQGFDYGLGNNKGDRTNFTAAARPVSPAGKTDISSKHRAESRSPKPDMRVNRTIADQKKPRSTEGLSASESLMLKSDAAKLRSDSHSRSLSPNHNTLQTLKSDGRTTSGLRAESPGPGTRSSSPKTKTLTAGRPGASSPRSSSPQDKALAQKTSAPVKTKLDPPRERSKSDSYTLDPDTLRKKKVPLTEPLRGRSTSPKPKIISKDVKPVTETENRAPSPHVVQENLHSEVVEVCTSSTLKTNSITDSTCEDNSEFKSLDDSSNKVHFSIGKAPLKDEQDMRASPKVSLTYHMRQAHPGCGRYAGGQGYNSIGHFCGGWAGNCGDGGIGGSTWYLVCDRCREKYLREKQAAAREKVKQSRRKPMQVKTPRALPTMEAHQVIKANALFLLSLSSAAEPSILCYHPAKPFQSQLPSVKEGISEDFPIKMPCLYLQTLARHHHENFVGYQDDNLFQDEMRYLRSTSVPAPYISVTPDASPNVFEEPESNMKSMPPSLETSPITDTDLAKRTVFQRSYSVVASEYDKQHSILPARVKAIPRRRVNSGDAEVGSSLLRHPSPELSRLISAHSSLSKGERNFQWPVLAFVIQHHDLEGLEIAMKQALRKSACRVFAMEAFNWLLCNVIQTTSLHDILWHFVASLTPAPVEPEEEEDEENKANKENAEQEKDTRVCEHPLSDIVIAGEAAHPLPHTFHRLLQTISDLMMSLPSGSALQQMALRCWSLKFKQSDHQFLHQSNVFHHINNILSKSDDGDSEESFSISIQSGFETMNQELCIVVCLKDLTSIVDIKTSSRPAMIGSLTDGSTETFWESGDEDKNKTKNITINCVKGINARYVCVHVDNSRDLGNKVTSMTFLTGKAVEDLCRIKQVDLDSRHIGWVTSELPGGDNHIIKIELKGPENTLRVRQVKVLGWKDGESIKIAGQISASVAQQRNCESETLRVFRLITSQVFGKLISGDAEPTPEQEEKALLSSPEGEEKATSDADLKEHMVGIIFSRSKLTNLQKQVCAHIVQAIRMEATRVREEWEHAISSKENANSQPNDEDASSDAYCFELLSMVLALSGSNVGRQYLAQQLTLLQDLFSLLHTASPRVQRQVTSLLRRVLPEVTPSRLASIIGVKSLPPADISDIIHSTEKGDWNKLGILDMFLGCIAKALTVQLKAKGTTITGTAGTAAGKGVTTVTLPMIFNSSYIRRGESHWWMKGSTPTQISEIIIKLIKDMAAGHLSEAWSRVTKNAIAETIIALTKMEEEYRLPVRCIATTRLWLALASLCVLDQDHVDRLSSGRWMGKDGQQKQMPMCDNHDDGETAAIILCNICGNLCTDCDRFLHLHRRTKTHQRQVFKEEEEAIKVDLHEGCGRTKLFWLMALADSKTMKAMVEFREQTGKPTTSSSEACRFCGCRSGTELSAVGSVCSDADCQEYAKIACSKTHPCGHPCGGVKNEEHCLPCLHGCDKNATSLKQDADDMCMICFTEALSAAPAIQLDCSHVFHLQCCQRVLENRWLGPRITFGFMSCPICKNKINHIVLKDLLDPIKELYEDVRRKALMRLEYEGLHKSEAITTPGVRFYNDPAGFAMNRYAYYVCYKCKKAYFGGEARCDAEAGQGDDYDPRELICGACSDVSRAQMCPKHGTDFLEYKCRYCCSVAVFFCFGTTHFCNACHDDFQRMTSIPKEELPHCPAGPKGKQLEGTECPLHVVHPPTGEEFALGCGVCRNAHTF